MRSFLRPLLISTWAMLLAIQAHALPFRDFPDRLYLTLAEQPATDRYYRNGAVPLHASVAYNDAVFRSLLTQAAEIGSDLAEVDESIFVTWLIEALVVSTHESHWAHFRKLESLGERCEAKLNSGELYLKKSTRLGQLFNSALRPISGPCESFAKDQQVSQLLTSSDLESVGIFQLALRWHFAEYVEPGDFMDVEKSIRYGLKYLYRGFRGLVRNSDQYSCLSDLEAQSEEFRTALVRGAWAGQFNSGQISKSCRFADEASPWVKNDKGFERTLNALVSESDLAQLSPEMNALRSELIRSFRTGSSQDTSILEKIRAL